MYELFEHTADLGLRARAPTLEALFADAGKALLAAIVANPGDVQPVENYEITVAGDDPEYLLFDWLTELLYAFDSRRLLLVEFDVQINPAGLAATCKGERLAPDRHQTEHEVKAITYHGLKVEHADGEWLAEVIVDI